MGGEDTGVTKTTKNVLLESAYFRPASVRRTARNLNLPSDASYRFERGVDPGMILRASQRATQLIREIAGGKPASRRSTAGTCQRRRPDVSLRYERCDELIGVSVAPADRIKFSKGSVWKSWARTDDNRAGKFRVIAPIFSAKRI